MTFSTSPLNGLRYRKEVLNFQTICVSVRSDSLFPYAIRHIGSKYKDHRPDWSVKKCGTLYPGARYLALWAPGYFWCKSSKSAHWHPFVRHMSVWLYNFSFCWYETYFCGASEAECHLGITLSAVYMSVCLSVRLSHFWFAYIFLYLNR